MRIVKQPARFDDGTSMSRDDMRAIRKRRVINRKRRRAMRDAIRARFWRFAFS